METKEAQSVIEAFNQPDEELEAASEVKETTAETSVVDGIQKDEIEKPEPVTESEKVVEQAEVKTEVKEKTWTELGLPQYEGLTKEQVAERIATTNREYGRATNTVGELRKKLEEKPEREEPKKDLIEVIPNLDEADTIRFNKLYETNPVKAILTYGGDTIKQMVREEIESRVPENLNKILDQKTEKAKFETFMTQHPDITDSEIEWMKEVDTQYLAGQNRPYEELYELSQMWKTKEEGVEQVYNLIKKHPTMTIKEAKVLIPKKTPAVVDKTKVNETKKKLENINHTSQTTRVAEDEQKSFASVQDAFDSVED